MLFERPNVRVHNDPLRMCPARESRLYVGTRNARGGFSLVRFFVPHKEMNILVFLYAAVTNGKRNETDECFSTAFI